jgi:uncharacterized delta-60 repeat protein
MSVGRVVTDFSEPEELRGAKASDVVVQPDGKIVVGGYIKVGDSYDFTLACYDADGSLDESFDSDGKVSLNLPENSDDIADVADMAIQEDGKIVVARTTD